MGYCHIHGKYVGDGCPDCRETEESAANDRTEMLKRLSEIGSHDDLVDAINNPGEFDCPHCRFRSLLLDATRCPKCHGEIEPEFWTFTRERLKEQRRIREEKERQEAQQNRQRAERQHASAEAARSRVIAWMFLVFYFAYLLPAASFLTYIGILHVSRSYKVGDAVGLGVIPVINWLAVVVLPFYSGKDAGLMWGITGGWLVLGLIMLVTVSAWGVGRDDV